MVERIHSINNYYIFLANIVCFAPLKLNFEQMFGLDFFKLLYKIKYLYNLPHSYAFRNIWGMGIERIQTVISFYAIYLAFVPLKLNSEQMFGLHYFFYYCTK